MREPRPLPRALERVLRLWAKAAFTQRNMSEMCIRDRPFLVRCMKQRTQLMVWASVVAKAADQTPQWNTPIKSRSSATLVSEEKMR